MVASLVQPGTAPVWDLGCEHGQLWPFVPSRRVVGLELRHHLLTRRGQRPCAVMDGLAALAAAPGTVVAAGIGERVVLAALAAPALAACTQLVMVPSPLPYGLRPHVRACGWYCHRERLVAERGRFHVVIDARRGPGPAAGGADAELLGPRLVANHDPLLAPYLEDLVARRRHAAAGSPEGQFVAAARRLLATL
ncbi:MAG: tRNA (adenine(22)-N(1))-methyltransferase TrmK [Planctomycetota bacterium]|jgi:tRNA A22 N-methylase|nr:tRNA (adenine(22)-N(1))-methyltransferase TrmK [Planctomycetota bacterium]